MAKARKEVLELGGPRGRDHEPREDLLPEGRHHQARARPATTSPSQQGALRAVARRPMILKRYVNGAEGEPFYQKRAPDKRPPLHRHRDVHVPVRAHRRRDRASTTPRSSPGSSTSAASSSIRTPCAPRTWIIPTSCASISIRCRASPGRRSSRSRRSRARCSPSSASPAGPRPAARAACTCGSASSRAGRSTEVRRAALAFAREVERRAPTIATEQMVEGGAPRRVPRLQPERARSHDVLRLLGPRDAGRARLDAAVVGRLRRPAIPPRSRCAPCPRSFAEHGDAHADIDDDAGSLDALLELADAEARAGDAPWPPHYAKGEAEAPRVRRRERRARAASRSSRSSRSRRPSTRPTRSPASSAGRRAIPTSPPGSRPRTSSSTRCAAARRRGPRPHQPAERARGRAPAAGAAGSGLRSRRRSRRATRLRSLTSRRRCARARTAGVTSSWS